MSVRVAVVEGGGPARDARGLGRWMERWAPKSARGGVTVAIVSDARIRALNRQFRGKDQATDVLSFPAGEPTVAFLPGIRGKRPRTRARQPPFLGEIVIARGVATRQARTLGHTVGQELRILALHGLLHLLGYDHEVDQGKMARAEQRLRRRAGLPESLIARSS